MRSIFEEDIEYTVPELKGFQVGKVYSIVLDDITIEPNKVQGSTGLAGTGLINKPYDNLNPEDKKMVDTVEPGPKYGPRYGDTITISFRGTGLQENQTVRFRDGLQFTVDNGEIPGFLVSIIRRLFNVELEPNSKFRITDYFKKDMKFRAKMIAPRSQNGRVAVDTSTLELDDGSVSHTTPEKELSENAQKLLSMIKTEGLGSSSRTEITQKIAQWDREGKIVNGAKTWPEIRNLF